VKVLVKFQLWLLRQALPKRRPSPPLAAPQTKTGTPVRSKQPGIAELESETVLSYRRVLVLPNERFASGSTHKACHSVALIVRRSDIGQIGSFLSMLIDHACDYVSWEQVS